MDFCPNFNYFGFGIYIDEYSNHSGTKHSTKSIYFPICNFRRNRINLLFFLFDMSLPNPVTPNLYSVTKFILSN